LSGEYPADCIFFERLATLYYLVSKASVEPGDSLPTWGPPTVF